MESNRTILLALSLLLGLALAQSSINDSLYTHPQLMVGTTRRLQHYNMLNGTSAMHTDLQLQPVSTAASRSMDQSASSRQQELHLTRSSVVFGLTKVANATNVNAVCHVQLQHIQRSILSKQPWAMKVLDASGTKTSGFVYGQNYWLGSSEMCKGLQQPVQVTLSRNYDRIMHYGIVTDRAPFEVDYRVIYLRHNSPWQVEIKLMSEQIIHIGLCLPSACASNELKQLTSVYVQSGMFADSDIFDIRPEVVYVKDLKLRASFYQRLTFKLVVGSVLITLMLMLCAQQLRDREFLSAPKQLPDDISGLAPVESEFWRIFDALLADDQKYCRLKNFVRCFDVSANWSRVCAMRETSANEIPLLNGLRSMCAVWIMIFHVVWYMYFTVHNKTALISYAEQMFFQYVSTAPLLVDVFFTISGFLQTYNFMRNAKQMDTVRQNGFLQNAKLFGKLLFHRYLRLGPLYLIIIGVVDLQFAFIGDVSVYHIHERFDALCAQHWWRNLLFIQNLFDHRDMCANWSWSLACDMQFFVLATIILFTYAKRPSYAKSLVVTALLATISWSYGIGINTKFQFSFDAVYATGTQIYTSPFVRVQAYIIGAIAAWCLLERRLQYDLSERQQRWLWHLSLLVFIICIYSTIKRDLGHLITISLFVLGRCAFALSVCWMVVGSASGRGVWWSRLLEAKVFQHVNRLSYAIYLLNPLVIAFVYSLTSASTHADPFMLSVVTCGFAVIVYLASIVFSLAFELPYTNLSSLLLEWSKSKRA